jgi:hypothetical protein
MALLSLPGPLAICPWSSSKFSGSRAMVGARAVLAPLRRLLEGRLLSSEVFGPGEVLNKLTDAVRSTSSAYHKTPSARGEALALMGLVVDTYPAAFVDSVVEALMARLQKARGAQALAEHKASVLGRYIKSVGESGIISAASVGAMEASRGARVGPGLVATSAVTALGQPCASSAIIALAEKLERTPSSIAMKLSNFASQDPALKLRGIKGLPGASAQVKAGESSGRRKLKSESDELKS